MSLVNLLLVQALVLTIINTDFHSFFLSFFLSSSNLIAFNPLSGILRKLKFCFPLYFGQGYIRQKVRLFFHTK